MVLRGFPWEGWPQIISIFLSPGSEERPFLRFEAENISNYTALLLSRDGRTLYVGAREALFALNSNLSFLPGGEYQEVRDVAWSWLGWAEDRGGKMDWKLDLLGLRMMPMGEEGGSANPPFCPLPSPFSFPSCSGVQTQRRNSSAASRARTHR